MKVKILKCLIILMSLWLSFCLPILAQDKRPGRIFPLEKLHILEKPRKFQEIDKIMYYMRIRSGDVVADIGAGSGFFTIPLAKKVGPKGFVFAEDIQKGMVDYITQKVAKLQMKNVRTILGKVDDPTIPDGSLNFAFIANTYHELEKPLLLLKNVRRDLRPHGKLVIIDWDPEKDASFGPKKEVKIPEEIVIKEAEKTGFYFIERHDYMPYHYFLIFKKK